MNSILLCFIAVLYGNKETPFPLPQIPFSPQHYTCSFVEKGPKIDGALEEEVWTQGRFSKLFVDIEGTGKPAPLYDTRVAMVFDNEYLYVAARLDEPHVWANLTERDSIIFNDNDFEIFIDPDGDTHGYYELEINALGTVWDLFLTKPYRDSGTALHDWNIPGLKVATKVLGTINDPSDTDQGWQVEVAIPWAALLVAAHTTVPPAHEDRWRMNFSRVQWRVDTSGGSYSKKLDPSTGLAYPENNWVWSAQGLVQMHYPEMWGYVTFVRGPLGNDVAWRMEAAGRQALRQIYYAQKLFNQKHGHFADKLEELTIASQGPEGYQWPPLLQTTASYFELVLKAKDASHQLHQGHDGRVWRTANLTR